jgi:hypothetical protein
MIIRRCVTYLNDLRGTLTSSSNNCFLNTVDYRLELGWVEFLSKSRTSFCINIYNLTPVESKFRLSRIKVLVPRCRKPYYLHSLSQIYLSKHVYYLRIKIGSQVNVNEYVYPFCLCFLPVALSLNFTHHYVFFFVQYCLFTINGVFLLFNKV